MATLAKNGTAAFMWSNDSGTTWIKVPGVKNFVPPAPEFEEIDVTDFDSPDGNREFINGLGDGGTVSITMNYEPADTTQIALDAAVGGDPQYFRAELGGKFREFQALVKKFEVPAEVGAASIATMTIKQTGAITKGDVS